MNIEYLCLGHGLQPRECTQYFAFFESPRPATLTQGQLENNFIIFEQRLDSNCTPPDPEADTLPMSCHASKNVRDWKEEALFYTDQG